MERALESVQADFQKLLQCDEVMVVICDETLALGLIHPGGAYFARISPETEYSLEERREGTMPPEIADELDSVWRDTVNLFAAKGKELREDSKGGGEG